VTNLPRRAQRAEASPIIACGPKHGESGAVRYFRMGAVAVESGTVTYFRTGAVAVESGTVR
jgi:hypothetical protein